MLSRLRSKSAPGPVHLVDEAARGARGSASAWRQTVSDCASTPFTPSNTTTAPSSTRRLRSTSAVKSTWPGRVDQVELVGPPADRRRGGRDRDAALLLLGQVVHLRGALVHLPHRVLLPRVEEHALGEGGLARVDVRDDAEVADAGEVGRWHRARIPREGAEDTDVPRPDRVAAPPSPARFEVGRARGTNPGRGSSQTGRVPCATSSVRS